MGGSVVDEAHDDCALLVFLSIDLACELFIERGCKKKEQTSNCFLKQWNKTLAVGAARFELTSKVVNDEVRIMKLHWLQLHVASAALRPERHITTVVR